MDENVFVTRTAPLMPLDCLLQLRAVSKAWRATVDTLLPYKAAFTVTRVVDRRAARYLLLYGRADVRTLTHSVMRAAIAQQLEGGVDDARWALSVVIRDLQETLSDEEGRSSGLDAAQRGAINEICRLAVFIALCRRADVFEWLAQQVHPEQADTVRLCGVTASFCVGNSEALAWLASWLTSVVPLKYAPGKTEPQPPAFDFRTRLCGQRCGCRGVCTMRILRALSDLCPATSQLYFARTPQAHTSSGPSVAMLGFACAFENGHAQMVASHYAVYHQSLEFFEISGVKHVVQVLLPTVVQHQRFEVLKWAAQHEQKIVRWDDLSPLLHFSIKHGDLAFLQWCYEVCNCIERELVPLFRMSCQHGQLALAEWIARRAEKEQMVLRPLVVKKRNERRIDEPIQLLAICSLPVVRWLVTTFLLTQEDMVNSCVVYDCIRNDNLAVARWIVEEFRLAAAEVADSAQCRNMKQMCTENLKSRRLPEDKRGLCEWLVQFLNLRTAARGEARPLEDVLRGRIGPLLAAAEIRQLRCVSKSMQQLVDNALLSSKAAFVVCHNPMDWACARSILDSFPMRRMHRYQLRYEAYACGDRESPSESSSDDEPSTWENPCDCFRHVLRAVSVIASRSVDDAHQATSTISFKCRTTIQRFAIKISSTARVDIARQLCASYYVGEDDEEDESGHNSEGKGERRIVSFARDREWKLGWAAFIACCCRGQLEVAEWLIVECVIRPDSRLSTKRPSSTKIVESVSPLCKLTFESFMGFASGSSDLFRQTVFEFACSAAIENGHLHVAQWLQERYSIRVAGLEMLDHFSHPVPTALCQRRDIDMLRWLIALGVRTDGSEEDAMENIRGPEEAELRRLVRQLTGQKEAK
jgi:hypothetical protein